VNTVKGGTGWGAELARRFNKPVYVFDQEKVGWYEWSGTACELVKAPRIRRTRFTGTGTRFLSEAGQKAVTEVFERSFSPAPR
jgi:hypothetical protein